MKALIPVILLQFLFQGSTLQATAQETECEDLTADGTCLNTRTSNLYQDTANLLDIAMHTYGYSCLRKIIKNFGNVTDFDNPERVTNVQMLYIDAADLVAFAQENKDQIIDLNRTHGEEFSLESSGSLLDLWNNPPSWWERGRVRVAIDTDLPEKELVYTIAADHFLKRVIVSFRGSENFSDWLRNVSGNFKRVKNPFRGKEGQPRNMLIHTGFYGEAFMIDVVSRRLSHS